MKRYIARCLYTKARFRQITQDEVDNAFDRAERGLPTVLSVCCHDSRDMTEDLAVINPMLESAARRKKRVNFRFAMQLMQSAERCRFQLRPLLNYRCDLKARFST